MVRVVAGRDETLVVQPLKTRGREVATAVDMAILLLVLEACTNSINDDGSMPTARIRENWEILFANGDVERPWQPRRYTALRDQLSSLGHIEWEDRRYVPAALSPTKTGQAAKWRLTEALMELLAQEKLEPGTAVVVAEEAVKADEAVVPVPLLQEREGEEDLYYDKNFFIDADDPSLDWFFYFGQPRFVRPFLVVGAGGWKMAA